MKTVFTYNEATPQCGQDEHQGWEVIGWPADEEVNPLEVDVYAVCRDEKTARLTCEALNEWGVDE